MPAIIISPLVDLALLLGTAVLIIYIYLSRRFSYWKNRGVPHAKPNFIFGNFKEILFQRKSVANLLQDLYMQGKGHAVFGWYIFGRPALLFRDPKIIKNILVKDFAHFGDRYIGSDAHQDPMGSKSLFTAKGQMWRNMRAKITPVFTSGKMKKMFSLVDACGHHLQEYLADIGKSGTEPVEAREVMAKFATDVISTCAFGIEANSMKDPKAAFRHFGRITFTFSFRRTMEIAVLQFFPWVTKLGFGKFFTAESANYMRKVFWDVITTREKNNINRNDLIDLLIQLKNKGSIDDEEVNSKELALQLNTQTREFTDDELVSQAVMFFMAGFETTSTTMSYCMYELAMSQDIQQELRHEIRDTLGENGGKLTYEVIQEMPYLHKVVSETLRKYPPVGFLDRKCTKDYVEPETGVLVEKGMSTFVAVHGMHRDPELYPDPERFDPERFNEENKKARAPYTYLPFGDGLHNCIGLRFGYMTVKSGLINTLLRYEILPCSETPKVLKINEKAIILAPVGGIKLRFKPLAV